MLERGARVETRSILFHPRMMTAVRTHRAVFAYPMVACLNPPPRLQFTGSLLVERLRTPRTAIYRVSLSDYCRLARFPHDLRNIKDNAPGRWKNEHRGAHL